MVLYTYWQQVAPHPTASLSLIYTCSTPVSLLTVSVFQVKCHFPQITDTDLLHMGPVYTGAADGSCAANAPACTHTKIHTHMKVLSCTPLKVSYCVCVCVYSLPDINLATGWVCTDGTDYYTHSPQVEHTLHQTPAEHTRIHTYVPSALHHMERHTYYMLFIKL